MPSNVKQFVHMHICKLGLVAVANEEPLFFDRPNEETSLSLISTVRIPLSTYPPVLVLDPKHIATSILSKPLTSAKA